MEKWFYNGTFMQDGTPISIVAKTGKEAEELLLKGCEPVEVKKTARRKVARKTEAKNKRSDR